MWVCIYIEGKAYCLCWWSKVVWYHQTSNSQHRVCVYKKSAQLVCISAFWLKIYTVSTNSIVEYNAWKEMKYYDINAFIMMPKWLGLHARHSPFPHHFGLWAAIDNVNVIDHSFVFCSDWRWYKWWSYSRHCHCVGNCYHSGGINYLHNGQETVSLIYI